MTAEQTSLPAHLDATTYPRTHHDPTQNIHLTLTYNPLDANTYLSQVSSPAAGANVLFLGTTRDTFEGRPVSQLSYTTYPLLSLKTLAAIAEEAVKKHQLKGVSIAHRLGVVPIGEASIAIAISSGHRAAGWRAAEEVLEACKERVEIWKREEFVDGGMEWRANADRDAEGRLIHKEEVMGSRSIVRWEKLTGLASGLSPLNRVIGMQKLIPIRRGLGSEYVKISALLPFYLHIRTSQAQSVESDGPGILRRVFDWQ